MKAIAITATTALLLAGGDATGQSQSNDVPLSNGSEVIYLYSSPSVGFPTGTNPPDVNGDLYWKALPGDGVLRHETALGAFVEIDGYFEWIFDTDWTTSPAFYDRSHGRAVPGASGGLEPAFFQQGWGPETLVSIGPSGFGSPCTVAPTLCSTTCISVGYGYAVDIQLGGSPGSGIVIPADGAAASDHAVTYFVPGGMTASGGLCGLGDYALQDRHSTDETMAGLPDATGPFGATVSPYAGFQLSGSGPIQDGANSITEANVTFRDPMLNVFADSATGLGVETGHNGGGATNALRMKVTGGSTRLGVEVRSSAHASTPNLTAVGASLLPLASPGIDVLGARLLVQPGTIFDATLNAWNGALTPTTFFFTSEGAYTAPTLPVSPFFAGADLFLQGIVVDLVGGGAVNTNVWRSRLLP